MDPAEGLELLRRLVNIDQSDITLVLCAVAAPIFGLLMVSLLRGRKLKKQVDALQISIRTLAKSEESRVRRDQRQTKESSSE